jgi:hypothetical protein
MVSMSIGSAPRAHWLAAAASSALYTPPLTDISTSLAPRTLGVARPFLKRF